MFLVLLELIFRCIYLRNHHLPFNIYEYVYENGIHSEFIEVEVVVFPPCMLPLESGKYDKETFMDRLNFITLKYLQKTTIKLILKKF